MHFKSGIHFGIVVVFIGISAAIFLHSCKHTVGDCKHGESVTSQAGESESHNMGQNCLGCHYSGGPGEKCFTVGGTVYDSLQTTPKTGGTVKFYSGPNGTGDLVFSLPVDKKGNFYTSSTLNFAGGLYPAVTNKSGVTKYMGSPIRLGACNSCHNVSTGKVWTP